MAPRNRSKQVWYWCSTCDKKVAMRAEGKHEQSKGHLVKAERKAGKGLYGQSPGELTIWKYPFDIADSFDLELPLGARILHVAVQGSAPCIWALVEPNEKRMLRRSFRIFGTGRIFPSWAGLLHVATFLMPPFVWHLFQDIVEVEVTAPTAGHMQVASE